MARPSRFSPEVRERAVRMVWEHQAQHASQWAAITSIAEKIGCAAETLRHWVRQGGTGCRTPPGPDDRRTDAVQGARAREHRTAAGERDPRKASAYFAQAELDRRAK
jgi:transposase